MRALFRQAAHLVTKALDVMTGGLPAAYDKASILGHAGRHAEAQQKYAKVFSEMAVRAQMGVPVPTSLIVRSLQAAQLNSAEVQPHLLACVESIIDKRSPGLQQVVEAVLDAANDSRHNTSMRLKLCQLITERFAPNHETRNRATLLGHQIAMDHTGTRESDMAAVAFYDSALKGVRLQRYIVENGQITQAYTLDRQGNRTPFLGDPDAVNGIVAGRMALHASAYYANDPVRMRQSFKQAVDFAGQVAPAQAEQAVAQIYKKARLNNIGLPGDAVYAERSAARDQRFGTELPQTASNKDAGRLTALNHVVGSNGAILAQPRATKPPKSARPHFSLS